MEEEEEEEKSSMRFGLSVGGDTVMVKAGVSGLSCNGLVSCRVHFDTYACPRRPMSISC